MPEIWLIRHGESESNAGLPTSNTTLIALTPRGLAQARHAAAAIPRQPALIVTSPYLRSRQTAEPAMQRFPTARVEEWPVHEFSSLSLAHRSSTTPEQRRPLVDAYWERCDPHYIDGNGAESFAAMADRARSMLDRLRGLDADFAVVYGHGLFTRALLWVVLAAPPAIDSRAMRRFRSFASGFSVPNASILKVFVGGSPELLFSNFETSHLPDELR